MKNLILICLAALLSNSAYSQSCEMSEEAQRHYNRAVAATNIGKSIDDYKAALAEYQRAAELCPDCSELYYRMGLCCEIIGEEDYTYYSSALKHFKKSLAVDASLSEELKKLIQGKIYEMEYAAEQAARANKDALTPNNLCGRWIFHESSGKTRDNDLYDITISENQGFYSVKFRLINEFHIENDITPYTPNRTQDRSGDISFDDNTIRFSTLHREITWYPKKNYIRFHSKVEFNYELTLENGVLKGVRKCSLNFYAQGHPDYTSVEKAIAAGYGRVFDDCHGNCGSINVYFTR